MAYGLRLISNNRIPAYDGRDWIIDGDEGFRQGKGKNLISQRGRLAREVRMDRANTKAEAAASSSSLPGRPRGAGGGGGAGTGGGGGSRSSSSLPRPAVVRRWERVMSEPLPGTLKGPSTRCAENEQGEAASIAEAGPAAAVVARRAANRFRTTSGDLYGLPQTRQAFPISKYHLHSELLVQNQRPPSGDILANVPTSMHPGDTMSSDLYAPPGQALAAAPVCKFRLHSEDSLRNANPPGPDITHQELPEGVIRRAAKSDTGKYHWHAEPHLAASTHFHGEKFQQGLSKARLTFRAGQGATMSALPL